MHHLILLLPLAGIVVFWLLPTKTAVPVYAGIVVVSGLMYWAILRAVKKIPATGKTSLVGMKARVVSDLGPSQEAQYLVEADGELWSADSPDSLKPGETVQITRIDGIKLLVSRLGSTEYQPPEQQK